MPESIFVAELNDRAQQFERRKKLAEGYLGSAEQIAFDGKQIIVVPLADASHVRFDAPPNGVNTRTAPAVQAITHTLQTYLAEAVPISKDARRSPYGKAEDLRPHQEAALLQAAAEFEAVLNVEESTEVAEKERYAPPGYSFKDGQLVVWRELSNDQETRALLRQMSVKDQLAVLEKVNAGDVERGVLRAILNSPLGLGEGLMHSASIMHRDYIDRLDPAGRLRLDEDKQAVEWARRASYQLAAHIANVTGIRGDRLADLVHIRKGAVVFGLDLRAINAAKHRAEAARYRQKAG